MKRALLGLLALGLGFAAGECLTTSFAFRSALGRITGRGELIALVGRRGIYEHDLQRSGEPLPRLMESAKLNLAAAREPLSAGAVDHEVELLRWPGGLAKSPVFTYALRREVAENLRARSWLEKQLAPEIMPNDAELRRFYAAHAEQWQPPPRFRASHLFLAAPEGYPNELIESKRTLCSVLATRLQNGESFPALVAEYSEDEASKKNGGDLSYFAEARMLPEIWNAAQTLRAGEISPPIRSRLGFHLLRLTRSLPARRLSFEEVAAEIRSDLENQKRAAALPALLARLGGKIQFATRGK